MNKLNLSHIAASLINDKWLLDASIHSNLCQMISNLMSGPLPANYGEAEKEVEFNSDPGPEASNLTAIINVNGVLVKGASPDDEKLLGLVNTDFVYAALENAVEDESVSSIVLYINSPGGSTVGIEELGRKIAAVDAIKPVFAFTDHTCASAAYWLASQARTITMTPSATIGNVGVYSLVMDSSEALKKEGVTIQAISAGKYKLMGQPFRALTEDETKLIQEDVTKAHQKFKAAILSKRDIKEENLEGLSYEGEDAITLNFADTLVDSFGQFLTTVEYTDKDNMKSYTKQATAPAVVKEAKVAVEGVPGTKEEAKAEAKAEEPKPEDKHDKVSCPNCKHEFEYPTNYVEEPKPEDKPEKKEEYPTTYQEDTKPEDKKEAAEPEKPEPKEDKDDKKALDLNDWRSAFGMPAPARNALYEASIEAVSQRVELPKS